MKTTIATIGLGILGLTAHAACCINPQINENNALGMKMYCPESVVELTINDDNYDRIEWHMINEHLGINDKIVSSGKDTMMTMDIYEATMATFFAVVYKDTCVAHSDSIFIDQWAFAPVVVEHEFPPTLCGSQDVVNMNSAYNLNTYQWYKDFEPIEGAVHKEFIATEPGEYVLKGTYMQCPEFVLNSGLPIKVETVEPVRPEIVEKDSVVVVSNFDELPRFTTFRWIHNGDTLNNESKPFIKKSLYQDGSYMVDASFWSSFDYSQLPKFDYYGTCRQESDAISVFPLAVEYNQSNELEVYPNPTSGQLFFDNISSNATIHLYDLSGALVETKQNVQNMNIEHLPIGQYIIKVSENNQVVDTRLVIKK